MEEGWIFKNLLNVRLEAMQRELQENPHDEANKATFSKALEELQAFEKKQIHDFCLRFKVKWLEKGHEAPRNFFP